MIEKERTGGGIIRVQYTERSVRLHFGHVDASAVVVVLAR